MPRIAFYCPQAAALYHPGAPVPHGGAEIDAYYLSRWLAKAKGWEVHALVARWPDGPTQALAGPDGVVLHPFYRPGRASNLVTLPWRMGRTLSAIAPDLVLQGAAGAETGLLAAWCRRHGRRFVYRVAHDIDCTGEYLRWAPVRGRLYRRGLLSAHLVLALTERQRELLLASFGVRAEVVPYAHPAPESPPLPRAVRGYVLWIGRFEAWKRPELVLELARRLPELRFRLAGGLEGEVAERVRAAARGLANVELAGAVPFADTGPLFARALALVSTSRYEGYPHAFLQALSAGTPVTSLEVDPDGALAEGRIGSVAGGDLARMAAELGRLASDAAHFAACSAAARERFLARHDLDVVVPRLAAILEQALARSV